MPAPDARRAALGELRGPREIAVFAGLSAFAACVPLVMRLPLPTAARLLSRPPADRSPDDAAAARLADLVGLAYAALRPVVRSGCLTRGVTMFWFLRRRGVDVELCFGVDAVAGQPTGHCWLVRDGEPFLEPVDPRERFTETYRLPRP